jgi:hypothetical protein
LISRIYKIKHLKNPIKKWANELSKQFSKEELQMANKYRKKYSTSFAIKENTNQKFIGIPSHPSQNGYHQNKQQYSKDGWRRNSYTVGENLN